MTAARWWHGATAAVSGASLLLQLVLSATADNDTLTTRLIRLVSFFTIQSNVIVTVVSASLWLNPARDGRGWRIARLLSVSCIAVTGIVYVTVLRGLVELGPAARVADTGLHYLTPALVVVGWFLFGPRPRIDPSTICWTLLFPVLWLTYTLVRGEIADWYPYPFVDAAAEGYAAVLLNCVLVTLLLVVVCGLLLLADRRLRPAPSSPTALRANPARRPGSPPSAR